MSQIPHSQLALKKRSTPVHIIHESDVNKPIRNKAPKNGASNGQHKTTENGHDTSDKDIIILDDEYTSIPVGREEIVEEQASQPEESSNKKKRGRRPKGSTDSRESSEFSPNKSIEQQTPKKDETPIEVTIEDLPEPQESQAVETKVVKLSRRSDRRSDRLQNASTIVNLSTVSSNDTKVSNDTAVTMETPSTERKVSGRRSTRPIDDIKFTYRSPDPDESNANATIGSEMEESLLGTPQTDRKRRIDSMENIDSPKRSRLDLSALFNNFYSPVTLLRDRFRKTNLASTPKAGGILDETTSSLDESAEDMKEVDLNEKSEEKKVVADDKAEVKFIVKPAKKTCSIM